MIKIKGLQSMALALAALVSASASAVSNSSVDPSTTTEANPASSVVNPIQPETDDVTYLPAIEFRRLFPAPENVYAVLAAFKRADEYLVAKGQNGYSEFVVLVFPDLHSTYGRDFVFTGETPKLQEIRESTDTIVVGKEMCSQEIGAQWHCQSLKEGFNTGLGKYYPDGVIFASVGEVQCETGLCDVFNTTIAAGKYEGDDWLYNSRPNEHHESYSLKVRKDGTPVMFSYSYVGYPGQDHFSTNYVFDFTTPVPPIELPVAP